MWHIPLPQRLMKHKPQIHTKVTITMVQPTDLRVVKTKRAIRNTFVTLLSEKDFSDITVTDIVSRAQINRKTFYNHYANTYELLNEIENEILRYMRDAFSRVSEEDLLAHPEMVFEIINSLIMNDLEFFTPLLHMDANTALFKKLSAALIQQTIEVGLSKVTISRSEFEFVLEYAFSGMLAAYQLWVRSDNRPALEEVSSIIGRVFFNGFGAFITQADPGAPRSQSPTPGRTSP